MMTVVLISYEELLELRNFRNFHYSGIHSLFKKAISQASNTVVDTTLTTYPLFLPVGGLVRGLIECHQLMKHRQHYFYIHDLALLLGPATLMMVVHSYKVNKIQMVDRLLQCLLCLDSKENSIESTFNTRRKN